MRIETERLELRSATVDDAEFLHRLYTNPEVLRYLPVLPDWTLDRAKKSIERRARMEAELGFAPLIVVRKATSEPIGSSGLQPVPDSKEIELLYHYVPEAWGRGYATEAAVASLEYGLRSAGIGTIIALSLPQNIGSWRVMEKAGMRFVGLASYYGYRGLKKYLAERKNWEPPARAP